MKNVLFPIISVFFVFQVSAQILKIPYSGTDVTVTITGSIYYPNIGPQYDDAIYGLTVLYCRDEGDGSVNTGNIYEGTNYYKTTPDVLHFTSNVAIDYLYVYGLDSEFGSGGATLMGQYNVNVNGVDHVVTPDNVVYLFPCNGISPPFPVAIDDLHNDNLLTQNFPNPLNHFTTINFKIINSGFVNLDIFDVSGNLIRTLVNCKMSSGEHSVIWNGDDDKGNRVPAGSYFYQLKNGDQSQSRTMILLK